MQQRRWVCPRMMRREILRSLLGLVLGSISAHALQAQAGTMTARDSIFLWRQALDAIDRYEKEVALFASPSATECKGTPTGLGGCGLLICVFEPGKAPCMMGRVRPCAVSGDATTYTLKYCEGKPAAAARDSVRAVAARERMLDVLREIGSKLPGDAWLAGQRVHYLVESGRTLDARAALGGCRGAVPWCDVLDAYSLVRDGDAYGRADLALSQALDGDLALSCELRNVRQVVDPNPVRPNPIHRDFRREDGRPVSIVQAIPESPAGSGWERLPTALASPCGAPERTDFESKLWWLADPSWLVPGNDRRAEHFARGVEARLSAEWLDGMCRAHPSRCSTAGAGFAADSGRILREGKPDSWVFGVVSRRGEVRARVPGGGLSISNPICGYNQVTSATRRYHFLPSLDAVTFPLTATSAMWNLTAGPPPGLPPIPLLQGAKECTLFPVTPERHTPPYAGLVGSLEEWQVAYFRRGDSAIVVAAADVSHDRTLGQVRGGGDLDRAWTGGFLGFGVVPSRGMPRDSFRVQTTGPMRDVWRFDVRTRWDSVVAGIEMLLLPRPDASGKPRHSLTFSDAQTAAGDAGVLARARFAIGPAARLPQRIGMSDFVFYESSGADYKPESLHGPSGAFERMLGTTDLRRREKVGLFWEMYGVEAADTLDLTISVVAERIDRSAVARMIQVLRQSPGPSVHVRWTETAETSIRPTWGRSTSIDVSRLAAGEYTMQLTVAVRGQEPVIASRGFTVRRR